MRISLIIIFIGLCTVAPAFYFGITLFDGKVTEKPYETGLQYNRMNNVIKEDDIVLDGIKTIKKDGNVLMSFAFGHKGGIKLDNAKFFVTRPATDKGTVALAAVRQPDGTYKSEFKQNGYGYFILQAQADASGEQISVQKNFYITR